MRRNRAAATAIACTLLLLLCCVSTIVHAAPQFVNPTGGMANSSSPLCYAHWQSIGPFAVAPGSSASSPEGMGAITSIWTSNGVAFAGAANGGVWRTMDLSATASYSGPLWVPMTDTMQCGSITAINGYDSAGTLIVAAACGLASSSRSGAVRAGEMSGVMLTTDSGATWTMTAFPKGYDISAIVFSGTVMVVSARGAVLPIDGATGIATNSYGTTAANGGIWRSIDSGATWTIPYNATAVSDLVVNPSTSSVLYASLLVSSDSDGSWPRAALLKSIDSGVLWSDVTTAAAFLQGTCDTTTAVPITNSRLTMTAAGGDFLGLVFFVKEMSKTPCYGFVFSTDGTDSWTPAFPEDVPTDLGTSSSFGTTTEPTGSTPLWYFGGAGVLHVYSISAAEWHTLSGATGAASNSAPHPNTLTMAWNAQANKIIAATEGGIYTRTVTNVLAPTLDAWTALNGNLAVAETFSAAFDPESGALAVGTSGNGVMISQLAGTTERNTGIWSFVSTSLATDGTSVGIDASVSPAQIYSASSRLSGLSKVSLQGVGSKIDFSLGFPRTTPADSCALGSTCFAYNTPLAVNSVDNSLVLVCTADPLVGTQCFSFTFGNILSGGGTQSVMALELESQLATPTLGPEPLTRYVFGGRKNSMSNDKVVFLVGKTAIWARDTPCTPSSCIAACTAGTACPANSGNALIQSPPWRTTITRATPAQHPEDYYINLVIDDAGHCWLTKDFGLNWIDLNLDANSNLRAVSGHTTVDTFGTGAAIFVRAPMIGGVYPLVIATTFGAFATFDDPTTATTFTFVKLGANYAHTVPSGLFYSGAVDELTLSTFGRGVWQLQSASWVLAQAQLGQSTSTTDPACLVPLYPNVVGAPGYTAGALPSPIGFPASAPVASSTAMAGAESSSAMEQSSSAAAESSSAMAESSSAAAAESSSAMAESSTAAAAEASSAMAESSSAMMESSSAAMEASTAMEQSSSAASDSSSAEAMESSSAMAESSSAAAPAEQSSSAATEASTAMAESSSAAAESSSASEAASSAVMESSSATEQSSSGAMEASSSAAEAPSSVEASSAMEASSAAEASSAMESSSTMDAASSAMEISSSAEAAMDSSSAAMVDSSSAMESTAAAMGDSSSAMDSTAAAIVDSSSAMDSTAAAMVDSSSAMDSSAAMVDSSSATDSTAAAMGDSSSAMDVSSSAAAMTESSSTADVVPVDSSSAAEADPSSSTGEAVASDSSSSAEEPPATADSSSTGEEPPVVEESSTGAEHPVEHSSTASPLPAASSSTGAFLPVLVQFTLALDLFHLPNGVSVQVFTNMLLAALNDVTSEVARFEFLAFGQPNLIVQVRVLEPVGSGGRSAEAVATALIALLNDPQSVIYNTADAYPILRTAMVGSAAQFSVAPQLEQPDSDSPFGSIDSSNGNSHRAGLTIGVIVGCVLVVAAVAVCVLMHWREKQAYNARKKALYERTQELMSV